VVFEMLRKKSRSIERVFAFNGTLAFTNHKRSAVGGEPAINALGAGELLPRSGDFFGSGAISPQYRQNMRLFRGFHNIFIELECFSKHLSTQSCNTTLNASVLGIKYLDMYLRRGLGRYLPKWRLLK
jgi:hypothetical protein